MTHNILIFGGTGLIGEHITNAIVENASKLGAISLFTSAATISTKANRIDSLRKHGVNIIAGDINSQHDITKAYDGIDLVVCCFGRQVISKQIDLIRLANRHLDVKHFFPSEYGTDIEYSSASAQEKPHQEKLKVRAILKECDNLSYTYVVTGPYGDGNPGLYLSATKNEKIGTFNVKEKRAVLIGDGNGKISLTTMRDCGKFVVGAILHLDEVKNVSLKVNSFTATPREILKEFEKQTSSQWSCSYTLMPELKQFEAQAWAESSPLATAATLRRIWAEGGTLYTERDNAVIGSEENIDSLESAIAQAIEVQRDTALV